MDIKQFRGFIHRLHELRMEIDGFKLENEENLKKLHYKDESWFMSCDWKTGKALEELFNAEKALTKVLDTFPKERKRRK